MATIRNLRNLVLSGIDDAHVLKICQLITNEKMVAGSRLFPFRFYTAFDVLDDLENYSEKPFVVKLQKKTKPSKKNKPERKAAKPLNINYSAIEAFRKALDKAVKIATVKNIPPIKGVTIILCPTGQEMRKIFGKNSAAKKSLNKSARLIDAALLLSLMCQSSSEEAQMWTYDSNKSKKVPKRDEEKDSNEKSLLARVKRLVEEVDAEDSLESSVRFSLMDPNTTDPGLLVQMLRENTWIDNLVWIHGERMENDTSMLDNWTTQYRQLVNRNLLFVSVDVDGSGRRTDDDRSTRHPKDLRLSGFSEQIFLCLASSGSQFEEVENIDKKYKLPFNSNLAEDQSLPDPILNPYVGSVKWKRIRVFISSTFLDMHGERDLLNRFVFPELSRRGRQLCLDILPVDLRWGLPHFGGENDTLLSTVRQVRACIDEIDRCNFFLGFLGQRYGWKPNLSDIFESHNSEAKSLADKIGHVYKPGMSITELEMNYAALGSNPSSKRDRVFFFLRDPTNLESSVSREFEHHFKSDSREDAEKVESLKEKILHSGYEVSYFCLHFEK
jgi:telomerase protein component 1